MDFKFKIGEKVVITDYLSQFNDKIGVVEGSWYSQRTKVNKYGVDLGGCDLVQIFYECDLEKHIKSEI